MAQTPSREERDVMWRTWLTFVGLYTIVLSAAVAITIDKCELIDVFRQEFAAEFVDDWVCIARWESHYNTSAIGTLNWDGSKDLGLFQVSEKWWCEWGSKGKGCRMDCNGRMFKRITYFIKTSRAFFSQLQGQFLLHQRTTY